MDRRVGRSSALAGGGGRRHHVRGAIPVILLLAVASSPGQELHIEPRVTARWEYSDHLFLESGDAPDAGADAGLKAVEDSFWTLMPGLSASIHGRFMRFSLRGDAGRTVYANHPELDGWRYDLGLGVAVGVAPDTTISLRHQIQQSDQPLRLNPVASIPYSSLPDTPEDDTLSVRERHVVKDTAAVLMYRPGEDDLLGAGYSHSMRESTGAVDGYCRRRGHIEGAWQRDSGWDSRFSTAYSQADFDRGADVNQWDGRLEIGRPLYGDWKWRARYHHKTVRTEDGQGGDSLSGKSGYQVMNPEAGLACVTRNGGSLDLSAGLFHRVPDGDGDSTTAFSGSLRIRRAFERGAVFLHARTGHEDRIYNRDRFDSSRYYTTGAGTDYALTSALSVGCMVFYRRDEYDIDPTGDANGTTTAEDSNGTSLALQYRPKNWLAANIMYTYSDQYSPTLQDRYTENRVMVLLTFSLPYQTGAVPARRQTLEVPTP